MKKEELLKACRYYSGTEKPPRDIDNVVCYRAERYWVDQSASDPESLYSLCDDYRFAGLLTFRGDDGVPLSLKAVLFNRFCQYNDRVDAEAFKSFYLAKY